MNYNNSACTYVLLCFYFDFGSWSIGEINLLAFPPHHFCNVCVDYNIESRKIVFISKFAVYEYKTFRCERRIDKTIPMSTVSSG